MLENGTILYHGSYIAVEKIDLGKCVEGKDFGKGFYLTTDLDQAKSFIKTSIKKARKTGAVSDSQKHGFVTAFKYYSTAELLSTYEFEDANKLWLWFIAVNRRSNLAEALSSRIPDELKSADIITGKIANDTTNPVITAYLNGFYGNVNSDSAVNIAISQLIPDRLKLQYCFRSQKSIDCLSLEGFEKYEL